MALQIKLLVPGATLPQRASAFSVGYDISSIDDMDILPGKRALVGTGISMVPPMGVYGRIAPRSGLAVKYGIHVGAGVIDPDYTGEIKVLLFNHGEDTFVIKKGDRIAQLVLERCDIPVVAETDVLIQTERGNNGFGSTGC